MRYRSETVPSRIYDVAVIGELNVDLILRGADVCPEFGQREKLVDEAVLAPGGSSAIFACQASKLGLKTVFLGKVGDDDFGHFMIRALAKAGVDTRAILTDESVRTGITVHLCCATDRAMLTYLGCIAALDVREIDLSLLEQARHLHVGSFFLQAGIREDLPVVFAEAKRRGLTVSLDPGWDPEGAWNGPLSQALEHVDVFLPNETEALRVAGKAKVEDALNELARHVPIAVIKLGAEGAVAQAGHQVARAGGVAVKVADTIGAGDSFDAGFIYGYLNGLPLAESLRIGCACGALSATKTGGTVGQPDLEQLRTFLNLIMR